MSRSPRGEDVPRTRLKRPGGLNLLDMYMPSPSAEDAETRRMPDRLRKWMRDERGCVHLNRAHDAIVVVWANARDILGDDHPYTKDAERVTRMLRRILRQLLEADDRATT